MRIKQRGKINDEKQLRALGNGNAPNKCHYDWENETKTYKHMFYYYVSTE